MQLEYSAKMDADEEKKRAELRKVQDRQARGLINLIIVWGRPVLLRYVYVWGLYFGAPRTFLA